jgi:hypothetical protein
LYYATEYEKLKNGVNLKKIVEESKKNEKSPWRRDVRRSIKLINFQACYLQLEILIVLPLTPNYSLPSSLSRFVAFKFHSLPR